MAVFNATLRLAYKTPRLDRKSIVSVILCAISRKNQLDEKMTLWIVHPLKLNEFSLRMSFLPNTWTRRNYYISADTKEPVIKRVFYNQTTEVYNKNPGVEYFRLAFHAKDQWSSCINMKIAKYPIAINSNYQDMRMLVQKSCFTIHGLEEKNFEALFGDEQLSRDRFFLKYEIPMALRPKLLSELLRLGVDNTAVYPDIQGFSGEMKNRFTKE